MRARRGRSPDSRIALLANAYPADFLLVARPVGFRPRSQWRAREGVSPSSRRLYLYSKVATILLISTAVYHPEQ